MTKTALLLAAGLGTRLRPLTDYVPKCLAPIRGRPLLEYWLDKLAQADFDRIVVNTHYFSELVEQYLAGSSYRGKVSLTHEQNLLGTAGTVSRHRQLFDAGPVLVAHADNLTDFDAEWLMRAHAQRPPHCAMTMMTFLTDDPKSGGIVELSREHIVQAFHEKVQNPPGNLANAAVYIFEKEIVEFIASLGGDFIDLSTQVIPHFLGKIYALSHLGFHRDIGSMESWRRSQIDYPGERPENTATDGWRQMLDADGARLATIIRQLEGAE